MKISHPLVDEVILVKGDIPDEYMNIIFDNTQIGIDLETTGLAKILDAILTVQIYLPQQRIVIIVQHLQIYPRNIISMLNNKRIQKIFHHAGFDLAFIVREWYTYKSLPQNVACTKIAAKIADKKNIYSHSLKNLLNRLFDVKINKDKTLTLSNWETLQLTKDQIHYLVNDVAFLPNLLAELEAEINENGYIEDLEAAFEYLPHHVRLSLNSDTTTLFGY